MVDQSRPSAKEETDDKDLIFDLSPVQLGTLLHSAMDPHAGWYIVQKIFRLDSLDIGLLRQSWHHVLARHSIFRTTFENLGGAIPRQRVRAEPALKWQELDWSDMTEAQRESIFQTFLEADRRAGFPEGADAFTRFCVARCDSDSHVLIWTYHHALSDGWSMALVLRDLEATYNALRAGDVPDVAPPPQFSLFLDWLRVRDASQDEFFWRKYLAGVPRSTGLLPRSSKPAMQMPGSCSASLEGAAWQKLRSVAKQNQLTLNTLLVGCWGLLLSRCTASLTSVCGTVVAGRPTDIEGVEEIVGPFINTVPVVFRFDENPTLREYFSALQLQQAKRAEYEHCPLSQIQAWAEGQSKGALFDTLFVYENYPLRLNRETRDWVTFRPVESIERPHYELVVVAGGNDESLIVDIKFSGHNAQRNDAQALLENFLATIENVTSDLDQRVLGIGLLSKDQHARQYAAIKQNRCSFREGSSTLHGLVEQARERREDKVALVCGSDHLTFASLDGNAGRLASVLLRRGLAGEERVGLAFDRSIEMVISALAVLKAGGAFVPIDLTYPADRVAGLIESACAKFVLTRSDLAPQPSLASHRQSLILVDEVLHSQVGAAPVVPDPGDVKSLAYVIFTSGSTGRPKGVMIEHHACTNTLLDLNHRISVQDEDVVLAISSPSFDLSIYDFFGSLAAGAKTIIVDTPSIYEPGRWGELIRDQHVTIWNSAPGLINLLLDAAEANGQNFPSLRSAWLSGDWIALNVLSRLRRAAPACGLLSMGGATEGSVWSIAYPVDEIDPAWTSIPYGEPLANQWCYASDVADHPAPAMAIGELQISGKGVARGYLGRPALTAERFVPDPFGFGARRYRTGDLCRRRPDGVFELLGRLDNQVKIRGFRVEPGEIETRLTEHPDVREAFVDVDARHGGEKRLIGYVVPNEGALVPSALREYLRALLPEYMVPSSILALDSLPLTRNGKIDRAALPSPRELPAVNGYEAPRSPLEQRLASIWAEVLRLERVGITDNFFEIGGESIAMIKVTARAKALGLAMTPRYLAEHQTVAALAEALAQGGASSETASAPPDGPGNGREERVSLSNLDLDKLAAVTGTLTIPDGDGPFAALLIVPGTPSQDRDADALGQAVLQQLATHLTHRGIAVLRLDKRCIDEWNSINDPIDGFATDVTAALTYLRKRDEIDCMRVGLLGHSAGGLLAPVVASDDRGVAFLVLMGAPAQTGRRIWLRQGQQRPSPTQPTRTANGQDVPVREAIAELVENMADTAQRTSGLRRLIETHEAALDPRRRTSDADIQTLASEWFRHFLAYDPVPSLARVRCPVLAIIGELDVRVSPGDNLPAIRTALADNQDAQVIELPGLDHLFRSATTEASGEWRTFGDTIAVSALETVTNWILARVGGSPRQADPTAGVPTSPRPCATRRGTDDGINRLSGRPRGQFP